MVHLMRKLKCQFVGDDKYLPEGMPRGKWVRVIGYETRIKTTVTNGREKRVEDFYYIIINDQGVVVKCASFNCRTVIDEQAELDGIADRLIQMITNLTTLGRVLSEKMAAQGTTTRSEEDRGKD